MKRMANVAGEEREEEPMTAKADEPDEEKVAVPVEEEEEKDEGKLSAAAKSEIESNAMPIKKILFIVFAILILFTGIALVIIFTLFRPSKVEVSIIDLDGRIIVGGTVTSEDGKIDCPIENCSYKYPRFTTKVSLIADSFTGFEFAGFDQAAQLCQNGEIESTRTGKCVITIPRGASPIKVTARFKDLNDLSFIPPITITPSREPLIITTKVPSIVPTKVPTKVLTMSPTEDDCRPNESDICPCNRCDVTSFTGTINEKIDAAMVAAAETNHKVVYFPSGNYDLTKGININAANVDLIFKGESAKGTILISDPIVNMRGSDGTTECFGPIFNIDRPGGFNRMQLTIENLTLDFKKTRFDAIYTDGGCSASGHGIRVGNGWVEGSLRIDRINILHAPGYAIGIQNSGNGDIPADNVILTNIYILEVGSDGLDTKSPASRMNKDLTIIDMTIEQIGYNDEASAAGLDISYDNFYIQRLTIITDPMRTNPLGDATNTGIRFRQRSTASASNGVVKDFIVNGCNMAVFFEGKNGIENYNKNITMTNFKLVDFANYGIYLRGEGHIIKDGCSLVTKGVGPWRIDRANAIMDTIDFTVADEITPQCEAPTLGSRYPPS